MVATKEVDDEKTKRRPKIASAIALQLLKNGSSVKLWNTCISLHLTMTEFGQNSLYINGDLLINTNNAKSQIGNALFKKSVAY